MYILEDTQDATLVNRVHAGDMAAFEVLIHRYERVMYTVALGMLGRADEARDATRAAFVRTYAHVSMDHADDRFFSAMHRLLACACLEVLRHRPRPAERAPSLVETESAGVSVSVRTLTFDERSRRVQAAIQQLSPDLRAVVVLRHFAGLSYDETAFTLVLPAETVRSRLHAARQQLGEQLLAWPRQTTLCAAHEARLQSAIDGELDLRERRLCTHLLAADADAVMRAAALRELGRLLNSLGPAEPPAGLASQVLRGVTPAGGWGAAARAVSVGRKD
jgi:RNA polymerase sigma-70 factor (ECF subfamily)